MSTGPRIPLEEAESIAREAADVLRPVCARLEVVGSVRRRRPHVGDIELLVAPHMHGDLFGPGLPHLEPIRSAMLELGTWVKGGDRMMQVSDLLGRAHLKLDLFVVFPPRAWGSLLAIRTGPGDLGRYVVTECKRHGFRHVDGHAVLLDTGERVPTDTEEQFFALADVPLLPPERRDGLAERLWMDFHQRSVK